MFGEKVGIIHKIPENKKIHILQFHCLEPKNLKKCKSSKICCCIYFKHIHKNYILLNDNI